SRLAGEAVRSGRPQRPSHRGDRALGARASGERSVGAGLAGILGARTPNAAAPVSARRRLDALLVQRGLVETRTTAQALSMAGLVWSGDRRLDKPGALLPSETSIEVRGRDHPWVSRGGLKMVHALDHFSIDPAGKIALDIGASTGGFTDV